MSNEFSDLYNLFFMTNLKGQTSRWADNIDNIDEVMRPAEMITASIPSDCLTISTVAEVSILSTTQHSQKSGKTPTVPSHTGAVGPTVNRMVT